MSTENCQNICKKIFKTSILLVINVTLILTSFDSIIFAAGNETISFQGKIVRNDTGYEGLNVTAGNPACVVSGSSNDTCDFQVLYYTASSGGTLLGTEDFANKEIGEFGGVFNLSLGLGGWTAGSESTFTNIFKNNDTVYIELKFAPDGSTLTETFSRMQISASAYAIRAGRADIANEADSAFQFDSSADDSGYTSPVAGMVYYDSDESKLKLYNGSSWVDVAAGSSGTSLFTDGGDYTYLTSTTDSLVLGASTYTLIGSSTYSAHLTGLDTASTPFVWDNAANRLVIDGTTAQAGLTVYSNYSSTGEWPLVSFKADHSGFAEPVLEITQDGTGSAITAYYGSSKIFEVGTQLEDSVRKATVGIGVDTADERLDINGAIHIRDFVPSTTANRLYSSSSTLYWNGSALATGGSLWTDGGTFSYLTSTTDDLVLGLNAVSNAPFYFDVSDGAFVINGTGSGNIFTVNDELSDSSPFVIDASGNVGIGTSAPGAKLDIAGTSSTISNNSGDITITADESVVIKADDTNSDNILEIMSSTGGLLAYFNSYGKIVLSAATSSSAQLKLADSTGINVASPSTGDLWWNGTQLYFNDGSDDIDLLTAGRNVSLTDDLFKDGFESGNTSNWSSTYADSYSSTSTQSSVVRNGRYAQKFSLTATTDSSNAYVRKDLTSQITSYYTSFYLYLPSDFDGSDDYWSLYVADDSAWNYRANIFIIDYNYIGLDIFDSSQTKTYTQDTLVLTRSVWHKIEFAHTISTTAGSYSLWIDGDLRLSASNINTGSTGVQYLHYGSTWSWYGVADDLYLDDIRISPDTTVGGYFLKYITEGDDTFLVDSDGDMTTAGDIMAEGVLSLGPLGDQGSIRYNSTDNVIEFSNDGSTWLPLGAATVKIVLSPEYAGAVLSADGSSNTGTMTSDSDANSKNYYEWNSSETSLNDYDVRVRFTLPSDFDTWSSTALTLNFVTEDTGANSKADIYLYLATSATVDDSATNGASSSGGTWTSMSLQNADLNECNAAGETCMLIIRMYSANDSYTRVGDIELNYNRVL